jgi:hypothetical protein
MSARTGESVMPSLWKSFTRTAQVRSVLSARRSLRDDFDFQVSLCIANLAAQVLGVRLTRTDQDFHKPIIIAEIGDTVDINSIQKVVKRIPNKKQHSIAFNPHFPASKSAICTLQWWPSCIISQDAPPRDMCAIYLVRL